MMKRKRFWFFAVLLPVVGLMWALKSVASWRPQVVGVQKGANSCQISPDGKLLLADTNASRNEVQIWDVEEQRSLWKKNAVSGVAFSPDSRLLVLEPRADFVLKPRTRLAAKESKEFDLVDAHNGRLIHKLSYANRLQFGEDVCGSSFSADGHEFRAFTSQSLLTWSVDSGKLLKRQPLKMLGKDSFGIGEGVFLPDKETFVAGLGFDEGKPQNAKVGVFDVSTARQLRVLPLVTYRNEFHLSPDGYLLWAGDQHASNHRTGALRLSDGYLLWSHPLDPTFSPDGQSAYIPASSGLDVLDAHTGRKINHLPGPNAKSNYFGFAPSPDGNWLYEARDGQIWKWRAR